MKILLTIYYTYSLMSLLMNNDLKVVSLVPS